MKTYFWVSDVKRKNGWVKKTKELFLELKRKKKKTISDLGLITGPYLTHEIKLGLTNYIYGFLLFVSCSSTFPHKNDLDNILCIIFTYLPCFLKRSEFGFWESNSHLYIKLITFENKNPISEEPNSELKFLSFSFSIFLKIGWKNSKISIFYLSIFL